MENWEKILMIFALFLGVALLIKGGAFKTEVHAELGDIAGSDLTGRGGIIDVTYNDTCVVVRFTNLGYKTGGPNHPSDYNIWVMLKRPDPRWICDARFLECWGVPEELLDKINWGRVVGTYQCYTACPVPQKTARFEDLPQEFFREKGGRVSEAVGVRFTEWRCPEPVYCTGGQGFFGEGKLILCYKEEKECETDQDCKEKYRNCDAVCDEGKCRIPVVYHPPKTCPDGSVVEWLDYPECRYPECPEVQPQPTPTPEQPDYTSILAILLLIGIGGALFVLYRLIRL